MQDLALYLGVLKHRAPLARGEHLPAKTFFAMDFCLCGAILSLEAFCFGAIPDIMIIVDSLWERATEQTFVTVAQRHRNQIIRGSLVIGKKKCLRWINKNFF